jgi:hypothetical protein
VTVRRLEGCQRLQRLLWVDDNLRMLSLRRLEALGRGDKQRGVLSTACEAKVDAVVAVVAVGAKGLASS